MNTKAAAHTPTLICWTDGYETFIGPEDYGEPFASAVDDRYAAYIVQCWNAHEDLVAALRELQAQAKNAIELGASGPGYWEDAQEVIRAALAKAAA